MLSDRASLASIIADLAITPGGTGGAPADWALLQRERIVAAEAIAATFKGELLLRQRRRIASLKRNLKLGPEGLKLAGARACGWCDANIFYEENCDEGRGQTDLCI